MALQAVIGPEALKSFTKTLTCLSRYGDDLVLQATQDALILSATNSAKSAFFHVKLMSAYFDKYSLKSHAQPGMTFQTPPEVDNVTGQLLVKSMLSILKHKTVEKTVDRCDLSIIEGGQDSAAHNTNDSAEEDELSSKLILRLHCKHGVVKTHRLLLFTANIVLAPKIPDTSPSHLIVGPRTLRDILDHFPHPRGDPQLSWNFAVNDVVLRSVSTRTRGSAQQLDTEISLSADEFDIYTVEAPPVSISFHLREFYATIALAEFLSVSLDMRFSLPAEPLMITFDTFADDAQYLFMISTTEKEAGGRASLKRGRGDDNQGAGIVNKSLRTATNAASASTPVSQAGSNSRPPQPEEAPMQSRNNGTPRDSHPPPLFLPGASQDAALPPASQLSAADLELVRSSGLGIEHMDYEEFEAMMEADGEEVGMSTAIQGAPERVRGKGAWAEDDDVDVQMEASQEPTGKYGAREFRPLFDD